MVNADVDEVETFFAGHPFGRQVYDKVAALTEGLGPAEVRVTKSQVAFRRRTGFCWVWLPGQYLRNPAAEVVISLALARHDDDPRWKQVAHVAPRSWMHHLEVSDLAQLDDRLGGYLAEAYELAR